MSTLAQKTVSKRQLRNFLLDARFQLKFTSYIVGLTLLVAVLMGVFLWSTSQRLFRETAVAVEARSRAAETSKELSHSSLSNELLRHFDDPAFEAQLKAQSKEIDARYEAERAAIVSQRGELVRQQKVIFASLLGGFASFILFIGLASIVMTHRVVGPLFRIKRMFHDIAGGSLAMPTRELREQDELKDVFNELVKMIQALRNVESAHLARIEKLTALAKQTGASPELLQDLAALEASVRARL